MTRKTSIMFLSGLALLSACSGGSHEAGDNAVLPGDAGNSADAIAANAQVEDVIAPVDGNSALDDVSTGQNAEANSAAAEGNAL